MSQQSPCLRSLGRTFSALVTATATCAGLAALVTFADTSPAAGSTASSAQEAPSFVDQFDGPSGSAVDATKWSNMTGYGYGAGTEKQAYTSGKKNAWLTGRGSLMIQARGETYNAWDSNYKAASYTSARLQSKAAVKYGTVSARIRLTGSKGAWPAFWMLGANYAKVGWPQCGELDVMEANNNYPVLYGSLHGPYAAQTDHGRAYNAGKGVAIPNSLAGGWHVYAAMWTPDAVTYLLDGQPYVTVRKADLPAGQVWALDNPQNILLNIAVGGMAGEPAPPSDFNATMEVDYVRVDPLGRPVSQQASAQPATTPAPKTEPAAAAPAKPGASNSKRSTAPVGQVRIVGKRIVHSHGKRAVRLVVTTTKTVRIRPVVTAGGRTHKLSSRMLVHGRRILLIAVPSRFWSARKVNLTLYRLVGGKTVAAAHHVVWKR